MEEIADATYVTRVLGTIVKLGQSPTEHCRRRSPIDLDGLTSTWKLPARTVLPRR